MSDSPENPVVALLNARRAELTGGELSIGEQERLIDEKAAVLDADRARLAKCMDELAEIDRTIALIAPPAPVVDEEVEA